MKKQAIYIGVFLVAFALIQQRHSIKSFFSPPAIIESSEHQVILYGTEWCGYCKKMRRILEDKGIVFHEYDIERSNEGRRRFDALNGRGVPVVQVMDQVVMGYDPKKVLSLIKQINVNSAQ